MNDRTLPRPLIPGKLYVCCSRVVGNQWSLGGSIQWVTRQASTGLGYDWLPSFGHMFLARGNRLWEATAVGVAEAELAEYDAPGLETHAFRVLGLDAWQADQAVHRAEICADLGLKYDVRQFIAIAVERFVWGHSRVRCIPISPRELICSEFVAATLMAEAGISITGGLDLSVFVPTDVRASCASGAVKYAGVVTWQEPLPWPTSRGAAEL